MTALYVVRDDDCFPLDADPIVSHLVNQFCFQCGMKRLPWMYTSFRQTLEKFSEELILEAISRTAQAPRPSYAYFQAILKNCDAVGAYDLASMQLRTSPRQRRQAEADWREMLE